MAKVLFVDQYSEMGGGQRILLDVVRHFTAHDVQCAVALPGNGVVVRAASQIGASVFPLEIPKLTAGHKSAGDILSYFGAVKAMQRQIENFALDFGANLVFCNGPRTTIPAVLACSSLDLPMIASVHLIFHGVERMLLSWCFKRPCVKAVTFCSRAAADPFSNLPAGKTAMVGNWVSPSFENTPKTVGMRAEFGLAGTDRVIGVVGRISESKGQRLLLDAVAPLIAADRSIKLVIAGAADFENPSEERFLKERVEELQIKENVLFLGPVSNTAAVMDCLDVLAVPSLWEEPFGLVAIEGMARGLPVVATASGGLKEIIVDGETGYLVEKSAHAIGEALSVVLADPFAAEEMGEKGRRRAHDVYAAAPRLDSLLQMVRSSIEAASDGMNFAA